MCLCVRERKSEWRGDNKSAGDMRASERKKAQQTRYYSFFKSGIAQETLKGIPRHVFSYSTAHGSLSAAEPARVICLLVCVLCSCAGFVSAVMDI